MALQDCDLPSGSGAATIVTETDGSASRWTVAVSTSAVNIVGTELIAPTNSVTLTGYTTDQTVTFSKPLAIASGGLLLYDAYSPRAAPQPWVNGVWIYGNNGGADTLLFSFPGWDEGALYSTEADAFAALAAALPFSASGYTTYKVVGFDDSSGSPLAVDNRGGLSVLVEAFLARWTPLSDLASISLNGVEIEGAPRSLDFVGAGLDVASDGAGAVTFTLNSDNDATLAANSSDRVPTQAAVKNYVDAKVAGLSWKQAVRAATTANITLSGAQTIDGVSVVAGDRVLVKDQATASQNGIYVAASGSWARAVDADSGAELVNATCYVSEGSANADTQWTCTTNATITPGTTALAFAQLSSSGSTPLTLTYILNTGATGTNVGPTLRAKRAGSFTECKVTVHASDGATALTFTIKKNGTAIFSSSPTVSAGASSGSISTFTTLTSSPLSVAKDDVFTIDVTSGSSAWQVTIDLE